jgi:serine/threonine-protein kinase RsbW
VTRPARRHHSSQRGRHAPARISISLGSEAAAFARLACFVEEFAGRHILPAAERSRLMIVLDELLTNVVSHGRDSATATSIEVAFTLRSGQLIIEFSDDGPSFDPLITAPPDLDLPVANRPIGGLGLHVLRSLVDHARYNRDCERNRLVLIRTISFPNGPERVQRL